MAASSLPLDPQSTASHSSSSAGHHISRAAETSSTAVRSLHPQGDMIPISSVPQPFPFPSSFASAHSLSNPSARMRISSSSLPKLQDPSQTNFYSFPSRGYVASNARPQFADQIVTLANSTALHSLQPLPSASQLRLFGFQHSDPPIPSLPMLRPPNNHQSFLAPPRPTPAVANRVVPVPATQTIVRPPSTVSDCNGYKEDRNNGTVIVVMGRKVRIQERASLYTLCRSWLKNAHADDCELQHDGKFSNLESVSVDVVKTDTQKRATWEDDHNSCEITDREEVDELSIEDLLKRHVDRAKKIRARLSEERLQRISKYRTRLHALLHPPLDP